MKQIILILSIMMFTVSGALAKPHGSHQIHGPKKPPKMVVRHRPPRHHHPHIYRYHHHCMCNSPYCIHRGYFDTYFHVVPGISVRVSI